jgi:2-iminobutanoate/2-iminopropanoate deaminase
MPRTVIKTTDAAPSPPYYSQAVKCAGLVFVSGTAPHDPQTGKITGTTPQEQTAACLRNIAAILKAAGTSIEKAVSATVILAEEAELADVNEEWVKWFPVDPPARQGARLPVKVPGLLVSIAMIAEA